MAQITVERRKLRTTQIATTALYGAVDIATEELDAQKGMVEPFKNITDWQRAAATIGGLVLTHVGKGHMGALGHDLFMSGTPLFEKSVLKVVRTFMGRGARMRTGSRTLRTSSSEMNIALGLV